ncbi:MAG: cell wall hydrolase [Clostridiaceae bacterium]|nr:cell wall hydrolase [Clostridiaceae bacterium]
MTIFSFKKTKHLQKIACAVVGLILSSALCAAPAQAISVTVDGAKVYDTFLECGRTYVPLRTLFEGMGWAVGWNASARCATISGSNCYYEVAENQYGIYGTTDVASDVPNVIRNGHLYVPIRAAAKVLEGVVAYNRGKVVVDTPYDYNTSNGSSTLETSSSASDVSSQDSALYSSDDLFWLARIIEAEAGGQPMDGKIAVGNTILNRVESSSFPDSIYGVIFDKNWGIQYTPTSNGTIYNTPSEDSYEAARRCLSGENLVGDCLFFLNPDIATSFWIVNNRSFYCSIGDHDFYL